MMLRIPVAPVVVGLLLAGCSSIIDGTTQEVFVNTSPAGAARDVLREGRRIERVDSTPGAATIRKTKHDIVIECTLTGCEKATYHNKSDAAQATFGNIVLGGAVGWAIDSASGADNRYISPVNITLLPESSP